MPEIIDYEHRRALLRRDASRQVERLNRFKQVFGYEPLTTEVMLTAAQFWAEARKRGLPTDTERALDVDVMNPRLKHVGLSLERPETHE